ncbi:MAG: hypothetical protein R3D30_01140 [Hyphomicrobiales bacterium]
MTTRLSRAAGFALAVVICTSLGDGLSAAPASLEVQAETGKLTQTEERTLRRIKRMYEDFVYGPDVRRYFYVDPETGDKISVTNELVLERMDGLIAGQYVSYDVQFDAEMNVVNYRYDAGAAFRGWGTMLVSDTSVTRSDWACGTSGCSLQIQVNGKTVYESK